MNPSSPNFEMLAPWTLIQRTEAAPLENELARELRPDHILAGVQVKAVAISTMTDDVLFLTESTKGSLALVHLTWSGKPDQFANFPSTEFYSSWESFRDEEMIPMHENIKE